MPELPVVGDAPSKAVGGAGGFITKRVGPLPLWAWGAGVGVAFLTLRLMSGKGGRGVTGAGGGTSSGGPATGAPAGVGPRTVVSPGEASGTGTIAAPSAPVPPTVINLIIPGYSQPNAATLTTAAPVPAAVVTTPSVTAPSSGVGSTPYASPYASIISPSGVETLGMTAGAPVPIQLSSEAIERGGIPAKDIPAGFGG